MYRVTKTYGHERGISVAFRQWRAESHCRLIHGYALSFCFVFQAKRLDVRNWVIDFGALKKLENMIKERFDHKLVVAFDDPELQYFKYMSERRLCEVIPMEKVGCEAFAEHGWKLAEGLCIADDGLRAQTVRCISCTVAEHGANSATYIGDGNESP